MSAGILYLHGFCSSPESWKAKVLGEAMRARGLADRFFCPALSPVPNEAIAQAEAMIEARDDELTLVGSSLGGYYATYLAEKYELRAALINPAVVAPNSLAEYIGTQTNLYTGESFEFTAAHIAQLRALPRAGPILNIKCFIEGTFYSKKPKKASPCGRPAKSREGAGCPDFR